jgi:hypothetical protein
MESAASIAEREILINTTRSVAEWEQQRDAAAKHQLDELIAQDFIFRRADGSVVGKAEFIAGLDGPSPFSSRRSEDIAVTVTGSRALAVLTVVTARADGTLGRFRNVRAFARTASGWSLDVWFNDELPGSG